MRKTPPVWTEMDTSTPGPRPGQHAASPPFCLFICLFICAHSTPTIPSHNSHPHLSTPRVFLGGGLDPPVRARLLLISGDIHPNPGPRKPPCLKIIQFNINGISSKTPELLNLIKTQTPHILALQETKLRPPKNTPKIPGYTPIREDRTGKTGGGLLLYIHTDIPYKQLPPLNPLPKYAQSQTIQFFINNKTYTLFNFYIPPVPEPSPYFTPDLITASKYPNPLILGDFNAHHPQWYKHQPTDPRGTSLVNLVDDTPLVTLNTHQPTRVPPHNRPTSPDITLTHLTLASKITWQTLPQLSSDHLPILIEIRLKKPLNSNPPITLTNFKKANWPLFTSTLDTLLKDFDPNKYPCIDLAEKFFRNSLSIASKKSIPSGRRHNYNPSFSPEIKALINDRNSLLKKLSNDPDPPSETDSSTLISLNKQITESLNKIKQERWRERVSTIDRKTNPSSLWKLLKCIENDIPYSHEIITSTPDNPNPSINSQALTLIKQFSSISRFPSDKETRNPLRTIRSARPPPPITQITPQLIEKTIKTLSNSKSPGPDSITNTHLKHLGPTATLAVTKLFNRSLNNSEIPSIWKKAHIIPILKPNKPPSDPSSYRPISLLSPLCKLLEKILKNTISEFLPTNPSQHGFTPKLSTVTALTSLTQIALTGFNQKKPPSRTLITSLDLSKAFDTVPIPNLIAKISRTALPLIYQKWLVNYLTNRQSQVKLYSTLSPPRTFPNGVPQGSVLSPLLFNFYIHDIPDPPAPLKLIIYADDITILSPHPNISTATLNTQNYLNTLNSYCTSNKLKISPEKSTTTILTPDPAEYSATPNLQINNTPIPTVKNPKILGLTLDPKLTFTPHTQNIIQKARRRLAPLRSISAHSWGQDNETLSLVYKQCIRTLLEYSSPAWHPPSSETNRNSLQTVQNHALRTITGCTLMTPIPHLHSETKILPLKEHSDMIGTQFFSKLTDPSHPANYLTLPPPSIRDMKTTPSQKYLPLTRKLNPQSDPPSIAPHTIHTNAVHNYLNTLPPNKLLKVIPPDKLDSETRLPRKDRVILAQLRSNYSPLLNSYLFRINKAPSDLCRYCKLAQETPYHILQNCLPLTYLRHKHRINKFSPWRAPANVLAYLADLGLRESHL